MERIIEAAFRFGITRSGDKLKDYNHRQYLTICMARYVVTTAAILFLVINFRQGMEIVFLDVGQGDGIYIRSEDGRHYLMDGGSTSVKQMGKYRMIPFLKSRGVRELEAVFISHIDEDHVNGIIEIIAEGEIKIKRLLMPDAHVLKQDERHHKIINLVENAGISWDYIYRGNVFGDGNIQFLCLHPEKNSLIEEANASSMVLRLQVKQFSFLLTGDVEKDGEEKLIEYMRNFQEDGKITILKAAHHGSKYSTSARLLELINPEAAVISCGEKNPYGHPHEEVMERLEDAETKIFKTPESGAIIVTIHNESLEAAPFRSCCHNQKMIE